MATIYVYERRDIMVLDVINSFIQNNVPTKKYGEERMIMKITGVIADMLAELDSETYRKHVVFKNLKKVIYIVVLR